MTCEILWNSLSPEAWEERFQQIPRTNFLQTYDYARAVCPVKNQKARWGLIKIDGQEAGLVQILEAGVLWNAFHAVILDRGPLWFEGFGGAAHIKLFFDEFNKQFPVRFGRRRRIMPEIEDGDAAQGILKQTGLRRKTGQGYETIWLDLGQDTETLRANLKQKWRNCLNKAEKSGLEIDWDREGRYFPWLMKIYAQDKKRKKYPGPPPSILQNVSTFCLPKQDMIIGRALLDQNCVAAILLIKHGRSATYQIGWSSEDGRKNMAHHLLLWQAIHILKDSGIHTFDLGGINDEGAKGVKKFKEGLGGRDTRLVGNYC